MAFVLLVLYLNKYMGFSLAQSSFAFAAYTGSTLLTSLLGGGLVDKIGAARLMVVSLIGNGLNLLMFPLLHDYYLIILLCLSWGAFCGLYRPAAQTFISHLSSPGMHKITFSVYRLAINLGLSIGPALGGYLATHSFPAIFIANGMANLLAAMTFLLGLRKSAWLDHSPARENRLESSLKWLKRDRTLCLFMLGMIPVSMVFYQLGSTLSVFLYRDLQLPMSFYGLLFTLNTLMIVFFELVLNVAMLNWPYRINFIIGSLLITLGFAGNIFAYTAWHIILLTIIWTVGEMVLYPSTSSYIADIAPEQHRGSYMSLLSTASNLSLFIGPWGGALIMQHTGANGLWLACAVCGMISIFIFSFLRRESP